MSYQHQFDQYLHDTIRAGGDVDRICVLAVAFLGHDLAVRQGSFRAWLYGHAVPCERCQKEFMADHLHVDEDDAALCGQCVLAPAGGARR